jgi:hypothetical protein
MRSMGTNLVASGRVPARRLLRVGVLAAVLSAGATGSSAGTLALMHTLAAAINVGLLTRLEQKEYNVLRRRGLESLSISESHCRRECKQHYGTGN